MQLPISPLRQMTSSLLNIICFIVIYPSVFCLKPGSEHGIARHAANLPVNLRRRLCKVDAAHFLGDLFGIGDARLRLRDCFQRTVRKLCKRFAQRLCGEL